MAARVFIQSIDRREVIPAKRSKAEALVRQLLAIQISRYIYQRLQIKPADQVIPQPAIYEKSEGIHSAPTRWEPPKHKRPLKAHPWQNIHAKSLLINQL